MIANQSEFLESTPRSGDDLALVRRARARDPQAFEQIMRRYNQRLYRLALGLMGEASEAEDVLQESYARAFRRLSSFAGRSSLGTWLARIVRNEAIDRLRARRARHATFTLEADLAHADDGAPSMLEQAQSDLPHFNPQISIARDEIRQHLEGAIASLPAHYRSVFMLREVEGLSVQETADYLDIPAATVKTRGHRARLLLREKLGGEWDPARDPTLAFLGTRCDALVAGVLARLQPELRARIEPR